MRFVFSVQNSFIHAKLSYLCAPNTTGDSIPGLTPGEIRAFLFPTPSPPFPFAIGTMHQEVPNSPVDESLSTNLQGGVAHLYNGQPVLLCSIFNGSEHVLGRHEGLLAGLGPVIRLDALQLVHALHEAFVVLHRHDDGCLLSCGIGHILCVHGFMTLVGEQR